MQTRVIYVRRAGELKVNVQLDRPEYRPGERAKLTLSLSDAHGKPVPGALSLAAVDEAVYSVLGPAPGMKASLLLAGTGDSQAGLCHLSLVAGHGGQVAGGRAGSVRKGPVRQGGDGPQ